MTEAGRPAPAAPGTPEVQRDLSVQYRSTTSSTSTTASSSTSVSVSSTYSSILRFWLVFMGIFLAVLLTVFLVVLVALHRPRRSKRSRCGTEQSTASWRSSRPSHPTHTGCGRCTRRSGVWQRGQRSEPACLGTEHLGWRVAGFCGTERAIRVVPRAVGARFGRRLQYSYPL